MNLKNVIVEKEDKIAWVKLNRPEALNALNIELVTDLVMALQALDEDDSVSVLILKGMGRAFCAGTDLKAHNLGSGPYKDVIANYGPWNAVEDISKPVIAAVHGFAITGGCVLAISCDIVIASEETRFADTHARWGLIPYAGEPQKLRRMVGLKKAKEMMFTSRMISAAEAERYGMVNKVVPLDQLDKTAREMAELIAKNSQRSIRAIKTLLNFGNYAGYSAGLRLEAVNGRWGKANSDLDPDRERRLDEFKKGLTSAK